jgi:arylsulfatase A-like enzyme
LRAAGLFDDYDIWVTSDHGFSTHGKAVDVGAIVRPFAGTLPDGSPRIVRGSGAVYVRDHDSETIAAIVNALQGADGVGAIFTAAARAGDMRGRVAGTLSFDAIRWRHERSADILFSDDWTDRKNGYGYAGITAASGVAGHGSTSPFDIHSVLMAAGPDIGHGATVDLPSGNVDFAPTFLHLLGIRIPSVMEGRVLEEALKDGSDGAKARVIPTELSATSADGGYTVRASFSAIESRRGTYRYLNHTTVERRP